METEKKVAFLSYPTFSPIVWSRSVSLLKAEYLPTISLYSFSRSRGILKYLSTLGWYHLRSRKSYCRKFWRSFAISGSERGEKWKDRLFFMGNLPHTT
jgi:hypothetical protein